MTIVVPFKQIDGSVRYKVGDQLLNQDDYTAARTYMGGVTTVNPTPEEELADITRQFESKLEGGFAASGAELDESAMTKLVNDSQVEAKRFLGLETQVATPAIQAATPKSSTKRMAGSEIFEQELNAAMKPYRLQKRTENTKGFAVGNNLQEFNEEVKDMEFKIQSAKGGSRATDDVVNELVNKYGYGRKQAQQEVKDLQQKKSANKDHKGNYRLSEATMGIPNARADERLALLALNASGVDAQDWNQGDPIYATDLMLGEGSNRQGIDVNRQFASDFKLPIFHKLSEEQGRYMQNEIAKNPDEMLRDIIKRLKVDGVLEDKFLHTNDPKFNPNPQGYVKDNINSIRKDYLISANMQGWRQNPEEAKIFKFIHGPYNPTVGKDLNVIDLNFLREEVLGRTPKQLREDLQGKVLNQVGGGKETRNKNKLNLVMPRQQIIQMGGGMLDRQIVEQINKRRNWGR